MPQQVEKRRKENKKMKRKFFLAPLFGTQILCGFYGKPHIGADHQWSLQITGSLLLDILRTIIILGIIRPSHMDAQNQPPHFFS